MNKVKRIGILFLIVTLIVFGIILIKYKTYATKELPKVYITVEDEEAFRDLAKADGEKTASLVYEDGSDKSFSSYIKIKVQGSTSAEYPKKNYTIKLYQDSEYSKKQKIDMGNGWGEFNKYCLKANWIDDKTHSRNIVTARIAAKVQEKYGLFTNTPNNGLIDGFPIEIYLNGEFLGLYTWNIPKDAWMWDLDEDNSNNIAIEAGSCTDSTYFKEEVTSIDTLEDQGWEIETGSENQETVDKLNKLIRFVKNSTDEEFINNFENYFNKDAMLNYLAVQYMAQATDNVAKNMILVTYDGEIWYPTLYDLDTTYGMHHRGLKLHTNYLWLPEDGYEIETAPNANDSLLLEKVIRCFPNEFAERWFELRKDIFSHENILKEFNDFIGDIPDETYELEATTWANSSWNGKSWEEIPGFDFEQIKEFLNERLPFIDGIMYNKYTQDKPAGLAIRYSTTNKTRGTVTATAIANRNDITFGTQPSTYTFSVNGTYTFSAIDGAGNEVKATAAVDWIDRTAPIANVSYSTTSPTNKNVQVTITANEEIQAVSGWTLSTDKKQLTKEYAQNKTETITIKDVAGNETPVEVKITNIDKTAPTVKVSYSTISPTNKNVVVTIKANEEIQSVSGWTLSTDKKLLTREYAENKTETIKIKDIAGNEIPVEVKITNIDKTAPTADVSFSSTSPTNKNVKVTITANEEIQAVSGWALSTDKKSLTKEYAENKTEIITIKDVAGNENPVEIKITNIDKIAPTVTVSYSTISSTDEKVQVTITADEEIQSVSGWKLSTDKKSATKEYAQSITEEITIKDIAGNETTVQIKIIATIGFKEGTYNIYEDYIIGIQPETIYEDFVKNIETNSKYKVTDDESEITEKALITTGQKLQIGEKAYTLVVRGDTNGDGQANIKDILIINKHRLNKAKIVDEYLLAGDVNKDEKVDLKDILQINKYRLGKITNL